MDTLPYGHGSVNTAAYGDAVAVRVRLSRDDWLEAALEALTERGVAGVAVEPLAARLGVTKGSFYWHFADRQELLASTLEKWEHETTAGVIEQLERIGDARERLAEWARRVLGTDKALVTGLHDAADDPIVAPVIRRVTKRRVDYLAGLLREAGVPPAAARHRARLLYAADLGLFQISRALPAGADTRALARELVDAFLP
jgi:AcrR family transcriptional regulator